MSASRRGTLLLVCFVAVVPGACASAGTPSPTARGEESPAPPAPASFEGAEEDAPEPPVEADAVRPAAESSQPRAEDGAALPAEDGGEPGAEPAGEAAAEEAGGEPARQSTATSPGRRAPNPLRDVTPAVDGEAAEQPCVDPAPPEPGTLAAARERLYLTLCGAAVWFDGLFGGEEKVAAGDHNVRGRVELSAQHTEYWGFQGRGRLRVRADLPRFERRLHAFLGREDEGDFVADRAEGLALRSQFDEIESDERWIAGLGYSLPGSYRHRNDVRVGARVKLDPDVFLQLRHRTNWFVGESSAWRFRETAFYTVQEGFGLTTSLDFDHILNRKLVARWGNVGTFSESTEGIRWRSAVVFYRSLRLGHALAQETYVRGESDHEVPLREYGLRLIYRRPLRGRDWLFGEIVTGYGWVREKPGEEREGSALIGFGVDLFFGRGDKY